MCRAFAPFHERNPILANQFDAVACNFTIAISVCMLVSSLLSFRGELRWRVRIECRRSGGGFIAKLVWAARRIRYRANERRRRRVSLSMGKERCDGTTAILRERISGRNHAARSRWVAGDDTPRTISPGARCGFGLTVAHVAGVPV